MSGVPNPFSVIISGRRYLCQYSFKATRNPEGSIAAPYSVALSCGFIDILNNPYMLKSTVPSLSPKGCSASTGSASAQFVR